MFIISTAAVVIKMPCSPTTIVFNLNIRFVNPKYLLKLDS